MIKAGYRKSTESFPAGNKEYEECVLCHKLTNIKTDMPIEYREYYVYGVGQLCMNCFYETYRKKSFE